MRRIKQCKACPWKKSTVPDRDIPGGYDAKKHRALIACQPQGLLETKIRAMACHDSKLGAEYPCVGWLVNQLGPGNNIGLRMQAMDGRFGELITEGEQYESVREMVETAE